MLVEMRMKRSHLFGRRVNLGFSKVSNITSLEPFLQEGGTLGVSISWGTPKKMCFYGGKSPNHGTPMT